MGDIDLYTLAIIGVIVMLVFADLYFWWTTPTENQVRADKEKMKKQIEEYEKVREELYRRKIDQDFAKMKDECRRNLR